MQKINKTTQLATDILLIFSLDAVWAFSCMYYHTQLKWQDQFVASIDIYQLKWQDQFVASIDIYQLKWQDQFVASIDIYQLIWQDEFPASIDIY